MANEKSLVTLTSIVNSFSADVKEMISFNLENLKHYYENQSTSDIAKSYMDLIKEFHKGINEKNFDDETKKNYRKLVNTIFAPACEARCNNILYQNLSNDLINLLNNSKHLEEENHQLKEENDRLLKKYNEKSQIKPIKYDSGLDISVTTKSFNLLPVSELMKIQKKVDEMKIDFGNKFTRIGVKDSDIPSKDKIERIYAKTSESEKSVINQKPKKSKN